ncbi:alpha/beta fold hydrolase [Brachybacterium sacelli]|uniref:Pimeloyl-ACP methyl ester carboxylesterase n=1 Tax=Brachybacterium sacelli TaxID=173364 RepID=A0ABS4X2A7_9MICO|nr:pimeloyl-ACP methyl ester carboxylesterase [Brachybacterium sacelli]
MSEAVVLVHGARTSSSQWDLQLPGLQQAGYRTVAPDLPGHGMRRGEPFTLSSATATLLGAVHGAGAGPGTVHLVGSSLGGMLAIHAAAALYGSDIDPPGTGAHGSSDTAMRSPLASLTLCGSAVQPSPRSARLYGFALRAVDHLPGSGPRGPRRSGRERAGDSSVPLIHSLVLGPRGVEAYRRGGRAGPEVVVPTMAAVTGLDLRAELRRIPVPVTILSPRFDQLRMHERSFARAAPRGRVVTLGYGTHLVNLTQPERFTEDLLRVLDGTPPSH